MCVGTATTIAIAAGAASAAGSVAAAKIQSGAAKDAAKTQTAAANQSLAFQQQQYQQQRQDFAPYQQNGVQAGSRLGQMASTPPPSFTPGRPQAPQLGMPPIATPPTSSPQPQQGRMVLLQAPDGSTKQLPEALAQQAVQKGAKVIG